MRSRLCRLLPLGSLLAIENAAMTPAWIARAPALTRPGLAGIHAPAPGPARAFNTSCGPLQLCQARPRPGALAQAWHPRRPLPLGGPILRAPVLAAASGAGSAAAGAPAPAEERGFMTTAHSWWSGLMREEEGDDTRPQPEAPPVPAASEAHERELHAVNVAVMVNVAIMVSKLGAWWLTSSG